MTMKRNNELSRRSFLLGSAAAAGTMLAPRFGPRGWTSNAALAADAEKPALLIIDLQGGYNALFTGADAFQGTGAFGVTAGNILGLGNGLVVDKATYGTMPAGALAHMASIGVKHGISDHPTAQTAQFHLGNASYPILLAGAMGGTAAIKAAAVGS